MHKFFVKNGTSVTYLDKVFEALVKDQSHSERMSAADELLPKKGEQALLRYLELERRKGSRHLRFGETGVRILQRFLAYFLANADSDFLSRLSPAELVEVVFHKCEAIIRRGLTVEGLETEAQGSNPYGSFGPARVRTFHQQPCTPETAQNRARLVRRLWNRSIQPSILLAGDDDLVSIALAEENAWVSTVIDIDVRVLRTIEAYAESRSLPITTLHQDIRTPLGADLKNSFDVVMIDPMYTPEGIHDFLESAIAMLKPEPSSLLFFSVDPTIVGLEVIEMEIEKIARNGLLKHRHIQEFNEYYIPKIRARQLRLLGGLFGATPLFRAMIRLPLTYSDMFVFGRNIE